MEQSLLPVVRAEFTDSSKTYSKNPFMVIKKKKLNELFLNVVVERKLSTVGAAVCDGVVEVLESCIVGEPVVSLDVGEAAEHRLGVVAAAPLLAEVGALGCGHVEPPARS